MVRGTGGSFGGGCGGFTAAAGAADTFSGTLATFASTFTSFSTGFGTWISNGASAGTPDTATYQVTYTLDPAAPNSAQSSSAAIGFTWDAQDSVANYVTGSSAGFESGIGQWASWYNATPSASSQHAHSGSNSLRIDTADAFWGVSLNNWPGYPATPGERTISFWAREGAGSGMGVKLNVEWRDSGNVVLRTDPLTIASVTTSPKLRAL